MRLPYHTLDVFTREAFGGNQLGVFPDTAHLPTALMQHIAGEMNLSETVFLGPPERAGATARVRIFTPKVEIPFAGHPTVGTALFLAARLQPSAIVRDHARLVLDENIGLVPVDVRFEGGRPVFAQLTTAQLPEHRPSPHSATELAAMIGVEAADVCPEGFPAQLVSCGLPYYIVPVRSLDAVRRARLDSGVWGRLLEGTWAHHVYVICMDAEGAEADVHVRMFAPGSGVPEDPATGSAAAALGGYLAALDGRHTGTLKWVAEQGIEMGRPSLLHIEADRTGGTTTAIRVGGHAVAVSEGVMTVPDAATRA
ncbi:MAG: PhzF family phenazine biosynthesis protein [Gemmatimonadetes bacterium]|nr:PhzF family phenazine biosynthesis protein [Gemmatimonadota bacterium]